MRLKVIFLLFVVLHQAEIVCMEKIVVTISLNSLTVAPDDSFLRDIRTRLSGATKKDVQKMNSHVNVAKIEAPGQRKGVCFNVAMKRSLKLTKKQLEALENVGCEDWFACGVLENYFKQITIPQAESLVAYIESSSSNIRHCGVMNGDGTVRSKWGIMSVIYDHPLWHVPATYGDMVVYFGLRKRFRGINGNILLFGDLKSKIDQLSEVKKELLSLRKVFLDLARGENNKKFATPNLAVDAGHVDRAHVLLKMCVGIKVDTRDEKNNTALMLAAERGDLAFVKLCVIYNACSDLKNNDNKTACMLARENNHQAVVDYLKNLKSLKNVTIPVSPIMVPDDPFLRNMRMRLTGAIDIQKIDPHVRVVKIEAPGQRKGTCYNVAMKRSLNLTKKQLETLKMVGCQDWFVPLRAIEDYFKQTTSPQAESLVVYVKSSNSTIRHCGVVNGDGTVRSKRGIMSAICDHPLWHVSATYGDTVAYFALKKQFRGMDGNALLFDDLKNKLNRSLALKNELASHQKTFFDLARGENNKEFGNQNLSVDADHVERACVLLKMCTGVEIDSRDEKNNTALMLAAERGDLAFVKLCVIYNACSDLKNDDNKTACMLAYENNHQAVVDYLENFSEFNRLFLD